MLPGGTNSATNGLGFEQVREQLGGLAEQPIWAERAKANNFGLPSFSAYPGEGSRPPLPHLQVGVPGPSRHRRRQQGV